MIRKVTQLPLIKIIEERFNSVSEIIEVSKTRPLNASYTKRASEPTISKMTKGFQGVSNADELYNLLRYGWSEPLPKVEQQIKAIHKTRVHKQKAIHFETDVAGFGPIVANALMGLPKSMITYNKKPKRNKILNFLIDGTYAGMTEQDEILKWGSQLIAEFQMLEKIGYRVRVEILNFFCDQQAQKNDTAMLLRYVLKDEGQPFDLKRFMFPLAHTAMFRGVGFDWEEKVPDGQARLGKGQALYHWSDKSVLKSQILKYIQDTNFTYVWLNESAVKSLENKVSVEDWNTMKVVLQK
jgi:hypothetical protein